MKTHRARGGLLLGAMLLAALAGCGGKAAVKTEPAPLTPDQVQVNLDSFDMVWQTIRDKHWDPELGGLDWQAVREELRPRVAAATTMPEARKAIQEMIARLEQSHFGIFPGDVYEDAAAAVGGEDEAPGGSGGWTGLDVRVRDGRVLVVSVQPETPAAEAGVGPGWEVVAARGDTLADKVRDMAESLPDNTSRGLLMSMAMQARLKGSVGGELPLILGDGEGRHKELELDLVADRGSLTTLGNMPPVRVWHETRMLPGDIGYFGFNYFLGIGQVMPAFNKAMNRFTGGEGQPAAGMIIDLRGNPGGLGAMAMGMAGWFVDGKGHRLGVMTMRTGEIKFAINPRPVRFTGPLAILVDEVSASTAEIMAGGLQDLGRARLFGCTTAGAALPSVIDKLPNGDGFQYAVANYVSEGGQQLEGHGVQPDVPVPVTRESLLTEGDPVLDAAVQWIRSQ
jgi:carboxyl-terminal processing protease